MLEINSGELVAIIRKSDAERSTLWHILACIDRADSRELTLDGRLLKRLSERDYARRRNEMHGIVMQDFPLVEYFSVIENVVLSLDFSRNLRKKQAKIGV